MPPRTRTVKSSKVLKENISINGKSKQKSVSKVTKPARRALADKTNSASDDNGSMEIQIKGTQKPIVTTKSKVLQSENDNSERPRRDRRLPTRFIENEALKSLSNSKDESQNSTASIKKNPSLIKHNAILTSPFKSPQKTTDTSIEAPRPRRICRLPSKFDDHSISPNKFIPVQPFNASTPIARKNVKATFTDNSDRKNLKSNDRQTDDNSQTPAIKTKTIKNKVTEKKLQKTSSDTNNNAQTRSLRERKPVNGTTKLSLQNITKQPKNQVKPIRTHGKYNVKQVNSPVKQIKSPVKHIKSPAKQTKSPNKQIKTAVKQNIKGIKHVSKQDIKKTAIKNFSYRVLEENKINDSHDDVYEFTYDPNEEPPPQKKKRKAVKKKPSKPKTVVFKNNYDRNVSKALTALKNVVAKKPITTENIDNEIITPVQILEKNLGPKEQQNAQHVPQIQRNVASKIIIGSAPQKQPSTTQQMQHNSLNVKSPGPIPPKIVITENIPVNSTSSSMLPQQNKSIRIEDIAADFEPLPQFDDINYSPVNSPNRPKTPLPNSNVNCNDPLNLRENLSYFEDNPVASSSMNSSARHPQASPWRVEFENLPIRWHVNSYVKPNMTPAVECSFINFEDKNRKKHVYTNMVPEHHDSLPDTSQKDAPNMIQTSIISFIREAIEKSSSKKKRARSVTPTLFNEINYRTPNKNENIDKASKQLFTPQKNPTKSPANTSALESSADKESNASNDKENSKQLLRGQKRKSIEDLNLVSKKTPRKEKDNTFFGFDDSENQDHENESPKKNADIRKCSLRPRARAVLKEINEQTGPTRTVIPIAVKTVRNTEIEKLYEEMKSASDAPNFPEKEPEKETNAVPNTNEAFENLLNEDSESVHLFEDIDVFHHLKPQRKSYGKAKKVAFRQPSSDSDTQTSQPRADPDSDEEQQDLSDLTFDPGMPFIEEKRTKKKKNYKQKMTKKEEQEAEAWAANFNSMCEDVEEFPLIVE